jgi:hypothetical protein
MVIQFITSPFLTGLFIGFGGALVGALVDALNTRRARAGDNPGGLMMVVAGLVNTLLGIAAIIYSLVVTGSLMTALIMGLGVLVGFAAGFVFFAGVWILFGNKNQTA